MIRVTVWYENVQESGIFPEGMRKDMPAENAARFQDFLEESSRRIRHFRSWS